MVDIKKWFSRHIPKVIKIIVASVFVWFVIKITIGGYSPPLSTVTLLIAGALLAFVAEIYLDSTLFKGIIILISFLMIGITNYAESEIRRMDAESKHFEVLSQTEAQHAEMLEKVESLQRIIAGYKEDNAKLISKQVEIYGETLDKVAKGEIPMPPNFIEVQEKSLFANAEDLEQWANSLTPFEGMEKDRLELEYRALELRAEQLNPKTEFLIKPVIDTIETIIMELNKKDIFGGQIECKKLDVERIVIAANEYKPYNFSLWWPPNIHKILEINFPNKKNQWIVGVQPIIIKPDTQKDINDILPVVVITNTNRKLDGIEIHLHPDGQYTSAVNKMCSASPEEWQEEFMEKTGGKQFLLDTFKKLFQREMSFWSSAD